MLLWAYLDFNRFHLQVLMTWSSVCFIVPCTSVVQDVLFVKLTVLVPG